MTTLFANDIFIPLINHSHMTPRQRKLLQAIIDEFIFSAEAVGSMSLVNKYRLDVSSATIRNEMAELMRQGYLTKPHTSAGRVPTTLGFKLYVEDLLSELEDPEVTKAAAIRAELFQHRFDPDDLIYTALDALVNETGNVAMALAGNRVYHAGLAKVPSIPEYRQVQGLCNLISLIEDRIALRHLLNLHPEDQRVRILFGSETDLESFAGMALIYKKAKLFGREPIYIGVIGPERMDYSVVLPIVEFIAATIEEETSGWR